MNKFRVFVISHARAANVKKVQEILGIEPIWIVGKGEEDDYIKAGASVHLVFEGGSLCQSRNLALDLAFEENAVCVQISDDIKKVESYDFVTKKKTQITFMEALNLFEKEIFQTPFFLYGIPPTANAFFVHKPRSLNAFCIGDFLVVKPSDIRFDENLSLKEDYDFTAQHIKKAGVLRFDNILVTFQHYSNSGGAVSYRNDETEKRMVDYIMAKHKGMFRLNPRRKNEILLSIKRAKKA